MPDGEFQRGREAGEIAARLGQHDKHFQDINGSIERLAQEVHNLALHMQRMADAGESRDAVSRATTEALARKDSDRLAVDERKWVRYQRWVAVIASVAALVTVAGFFTSFFRH